MFNRKRHAFNRTIVELKHWEPAPFSEHVTLLIEPLWN